MKVIFALLFLPMYAMAADWTLVLVNEETELEIDLASVRSSRGAWFKFIYTPPVANSCAWKGEKTAYTKDYIEAKCKDGTIRTKQTIAYDVGGDVITPCGGDSPDAIFREYAPETFGEAMFQAICDSKEKTRNRSKFMMYLRERKLERRIAKQAALEREQKEAETREKIRQQMLEANRAYRPESGKKPWGALCTTSSECFGTLVCAKVGFYPDRCMSSDSAINGLYVDR